MSNFIEKNCDLTNSEQLSDFLINRFRSNLEAFKKYFPKIASEFECYIPKQSMDFFCSENGTPNMCFSDDNLSFYEKHSPIQFLEFSSNSLLTTLSNNEEKIDVTDPKEFCKYQVDAMLRAKFNLINTNDKPDPYGQLHYKYLNSMIKYYNGTTKERCKISDCLIVPFFVMVGVGLGYQLEEMYRRIDIANLVIIDPNKDVFFASLHTFDWAKFLSHFDSEKQHIYFILDDDLNKVGLGVYSAFLLSGLYNIGANFIYYHYEDESNLKIQKELVFNYKHVPSALGFFDDKVFGIAHSCYSLCHKKSFVLNVEMKDEYQRLPVFIIGSGPSLDRDLPFIRKYQDKALIIACGTAIDALYHSGIKADFYANTERTPEIFQTLSIIPDKSYFDDIFLLCSGVTHPSVVNLFQHTAIFGKKDEAFFECLAANLNLKNIDTVSHMNPLVGNMGVSGAIRLGFKKIFLFGLDNGKKSSEQSIHSLYTTLYNELGCPTDGVQFITNKYVDANFGGVCETNDLFIQSVSMIEISVKNFLKTKGGECFNCSDGILIKGAVPVHSEELISKFNLLEDIDKTEFKKYLASEKTQCFDISEEQLKKVIYPQIYERICSNIREIIKNRPSDLKGWIDLIQTVWNFLNNIAKDLSPFYAGVTESSVSSMLTVLTGALFATNDPDERQKNANYLMDIIDDYLQESPIVFEKLPDYIMGEHRKYYPDGKVGKDMPHVSAPNFPSEVNLIKEKYDDPQKTFKKRYE
ncbi:motility associated factor glycosyltransferase family protein [Succinivibrio dextrinosolvens]|nr:6-hydroxymethylpterin diphosphokinase MptE-like protein [Succinivibrio dextrinosolvens]